MSWGTGQNDQPQERARERKTGRRQDPPRKRPGDTRRGREEGSGGLAWNWGGNPAGGVAGETRAVHLV